ncbi:hypothetical protein GQ54DRAFT_98389 [Martensiomyces pterosporus]|nr:hypothetical protein GQ54DRAFT_98389 [Martensiomyces pterosporus]
MSQKQSGGDSSSSARGPGLRRSVSLRLLARSVRGRTKSTADLKEQQQPFKRALQSKPTDYFSGLELPGDDSKDFIGGAHHREAGEEQGSDAKAESLLGRLHSTSKKGQKMDLVSTHCAPRFVKRSAYLTDASARSYTVTGYPKSTRSSKRNAAASTSTSAHQTVVTKESAEISDENHHQKKKKQASQQPKLKGFQVRVINTHSGRTVVRAPVLDEPGDGADADAQGASESLPPSAAELKYTAQRALINTTAVLRATTSVANSAAPGGSSAKPDTPAGSAAINVQIGSKSGGAGAGADATRASGPNATATASAVPAQKQRSPPKVQSARATSGRRRQQQQQQQRRQRAKDDSGFQINLQFESEQSVSGSSNGNATGGNGTANGTAAPGVGQMVQGRASTESVLESWGISTPTDTAPAAGAQQGGCRDDSGRTLATSEDDSDVDSAVEDTIRMVEGMSRGYPATIDSVLSHRNHSPPPPCMPFAPPLFCAPFAFTRSDLAGAAFSQLSYEAALCRVRTPVCMCTTPLIYLCLCRPRLAKLHASKQRRLET